MAGLLNLADFALDPEIKTKAAQMAQMLMQNWLLVANDKAAYYPAAGRNYGEQYTSLDPKSIIWISTGVGPMRTDTDYAGAFISTSSIDLRDVAASWRISLNTIFSFGHSPSEKLTVHSCQPRFDRTIFQWSAGGYIHPDCADDTLWLVNEYSLENNHHFVYKLTKPTTMPTKLAKKDNLV